MSYNFDPELQSLLEFLPDTSLGINDPVKARAGFLEMIALLNADVDRSGVAIENRNIPGPAGAPDVPVRIYIPEGLNQTVPGILHIHGGGFVIGDLDSELGSCVALCRNLGVVVVSVDYRLAPETPYPGPLEDCYAALQWVSSNSAQLQIDPARLAVFGLSAGGGLSAATGAARQGPRRPADLLPVPRHSRTGRPPANRQHAALCRYADVEPAQRRTQLGFLPGRPVPARRGRCALPRGAGPGRGSVRACRRPTSAPWSSTRCATKAWSMR